LAVADLVLNGLLAAARIVVEHPRAGVQRCRIVNDLFRHTKLGLSDTVRAVACALPTLPVDFRQPLPDLNLVHVALMPYSDLCLINIYLLENRVLSYSTRANDRLERNEPKGSRCVLRGGCGGNVAPLPDRARLATRHPWSNHPGMSTLFLHGLG
jgi:hypothetical protein